MKRTSSVLVSLALAALLAACGGAGETPRFRLTDITGAKFAADFRLTDHNGRPRALADFRGRVVTVFFGFTHCPDACPAALQEMAQVVRELGADGPKVQVLFVTVDPERDTPEVLRRYVPAFHPDFLGLHGDEEAIARTARDFKVFYRKQPLPGGGYTVDHGAGTYIFDRAGRLRLYAQHGQGPAAILHDIRILLAS